MTAPQPTDPPTDPSTDPPTPSDPPPAPAAKRTVEELLAQLPDEDREVVSGQLRKARDDAAGYRAKLREAEPKAKEYDRLAEASKTELERAQEATQQAQDRITSLTVRAIGSEVRAMASAAFADPDDAVAFLANGQGLASYANDSGEIDGNRIAADLTDLLKRKPHLAKSAERRIPAPNPAVGSSPSGEPDAEAQIAQATKAGDWRTVMQLQNQKLAALRPQQT